MDPRAHRHRAASLRRRRRNHRRHGRARRAPRHRSCGRRAGATSISSCSAPPRPISCSRTAARCCRRASAARGCPAFSVEAACSGFIYALSIADKFVRAGEAKCALVVGAETLSRITDFTDRTTAILFADGAGAVVLEAVGGAGHAVARICMPMARTRICCTARGGISKGYRAIRHRQGRVASAWRAAKCSRSR